MDTEDGDFDGGLSGPQEEKSEKVAPHPIEGHEPDGMQLLTSSLFLYIFPAGD